jgi:DNA-binding transcriptional MerR regulator
MGSHKYRDVYTTGYIAKICRVSTRTVINWIDSGLMEGYRIPGRNDRRYRRVTEANLLLFLKKNNFPCKEFESKLKNTKVIFNLKSQEVPEDYALVVSQIKLGIYVTQNNIAEAIIGDDEGQKVLTDAVEVIREYNPNVKVTAVVFEDVNVAVLRHILQCDVLYRTEFNLNPY